MDLVYDSQTAKATVINEQLTAVSPAALFGMRSSTTNLLTFGYYGGNISNNGVITAIADGTVSLTASSTNYVEATTAGVVSVNTVGFTGGSIPMYQVTTDATAITALVDKRVLWSPGPYTPSAIPFIGALIKPSADRLTQNFSTAAAVSWDAEVYDSHGFHDNVTNPTRITIPAGYSITRVRVMGQIRMNLMTAAGAFKILLLKNGVVVNGGGSMIMQAGTTFSSAMAQVMSAVISVSDGDYFELQIEYDSDTSVTLVADESWFSVEAVEAGTVAIHKSKLSTIASSAGVLSISLDQGEYFKTTLTENVTSVTMAGITTGLVNRFKLMIVQDGAAAKTWANPASWKFPGGTAYVVSAGLGAVDVLEGVSYDDGTTWQVTYNKAFA